MNKSSIAAASLIPATIVFVARPATGLAIGGAAIAASAALVAAATGRVDVAQGLGATAAGLFTGGLLRAAVYGSPLAQPYTEMVQLRNAPQPTGPSALVHLPAGFDPGHSFDVLLYLRGWNSCVEAIAAPAPRPCREGGPARQNSDVIGQVDRVSSQIVLVMPEWPMEQPSSDPGTLAREGAFRAFLEEVITQVVSTASGASLGIQDVRRVMIAAHSGGYLPAARALDRGQLPNVTDVLLLDALYGEVPAFERFVTGGGRLFTLFTSGATERNSIALARSVNGTIDTTTTVITPEQWRLNMLAKRTAQTHSAVPLHYLQDWLASR